MKFSSAILLIFLAVIHFGATAHDFYIGMTEIRYSEDSKSYQITLKLFTDDLEDAVNNYSASHLNLGNESETSKSDSLVYKYISQNFSIKNSKGTELELSRIGLETELDVTWVYYEVLNSPMENELKVKNSIFLEIHPEQTHVVNITQSGITKSTLLYSGKTADILKL